MGPSTDFTEALAVLGLTVVPQDPEALACQVAMGDTQSLACRVVWEAVEERIDSRTRVTSEPTACGTVIPCSGHHRCTYLSGRDAPINCHLRQLNPWICLYQHARIGAPAPFGSWASRLRS